MVSPKGGEVVARRRYQGLRSRRRNHRNGEKGTTRLPAPCHPRAGKPKEPSEDGATDGKHKRVR
eukprot:1432756-Prorocentrum_lima.AAC.1